MFHTKSHKVINVLFFTQLTLQIINNVLKIVLCTQASKHMLPVPGTGMYTIIATLCALFGQRLNFII